MILDLRTVESHIAFLMDGMHGIFPSLHFSSCPKTLGDYVRQTLMFLLLCSLPYVVFLKGIMSLHVSSFLYRRTQKAGVLLLFWRASAIVWLLVEGKHR